MNTHFLPYNEDSVVYGMQFLRGDAEFDHYENILANAYNKLGFDLARIKVPPRGQRFFIRRNQQVAAIGALSQVQRGEHYFRYIPELQGLSAQDTRVCEVHNVIVLDEARGGYTLAVLMYECAKWAVAHSYQYIVGLTRYQVLRHFVAFGINPVQHPPLSLLGQPHLKDFIIYYDTHSPEALRYMHARARNYFQQERTMRRIKELYLRREPAHESL
ncbi:MAG: hypothetical protein ABWY06_03745 [Pseudomonas sp.]|uniref:hypothetical protein n=1 Tax=Pseudomonas sp. TaxID=306 RepID=UPI0033938D43